MDILNNDIKNRMLRLFDNSDYITIYYKEKDKSFTASKVIQKNKNGYTIENIIKLLCYLYNDNNVIQLYITYNLSLSLYGKIPIKDVKEGIFNIDSGSKLFKQYVVEYSLI